jgi:hypothetical protein
MKKALPESLAELEQERDRLKNEIAGLPDFRQGSLSIVRPRCGKSTCHCAQEGDPGHGPFYFLIRGVNKKTVTRSIPPQNLDTVKEQVAVFHHYQELSRALVNVSGQICDLKLSNPGDSLEAVKKNTRKRPGS